ncbi:MAG: dUTP diphosphatase [Candidatus Izemoplasmatales bacterium]|nr:dUTP diphosphatase [Candidatus Izemoplasmatales bacterium]
MKTRGFEIVSKYYNQDILLPERKTMGSAGYDIACAKDTVIEPNNFKFVPTGIKAFMGKDEVLQVYPRSSLSFKKHLVKLNSVGIIDSDYYNNLDNEGEIMLILYNYGTEKVLLKKHERIAQGLFMKYLTIDNDETEVKRLGGLGSTGN